MITAFFVAGGAAFWVLTLLILIAMVVAIECESGFWATGFIVAWLAAIHLLGDVNLFSWIGNHPAITAGIIGGYFAAGTAWCFAKWYFWLRKELRSRRELLVDFKYGYDQNQVDYNLAKEDLKERPPLDDPEAQKKDDAYRDRIEKDWARDQAHWTRMRKDLSEAPQARTNKSRILRWMTFWPLSALWTLIDDPIREAFRKIYDQISGRLQRISDRMFADLETDLV